MIDVHMLVGVDKGVEHASCSPELKLTSKYAGKGNSKIKTSQCLGAAPKPCYISCAISLYSPQRIFLVQIERLSESIFVCGCCMQYDTVDISTHKFSRVF